MPAFDIYTMATEAGNKGRYHAAVKFYELLLKHLWLLQSLNSNISQAVHEYFNVEGNIGGPRQDI